MEQNPSFSTAGDPAAQPARELGISASATEASIIALLSSRQFEVIYDQPYRGTDEEVMNLITQCDNLINTLAGAKVNDRLELLVAAIDACLLDNLQAQEVRTIIKTIVKKDIRLLSHMPRTRAMLEHVLRAVRLSQLLAPSKLRKLTQDIQRYQQQYGGSAA